MSVALPKIAVTMGDAGGVGPELCLRLLANDELAQLCTPIIFGDAGVLHRAATVTGLPFATPIVPRTQWLAEFAHIRTPSVLDFSTDPAKKFDLSQLTPGVSDAQTGAASYAFVDAAIDAALAGQVAAVTTCPLSKEALHAAGHKFPGHTEIFAGRTQAERSCMMQYSEEITCSFVTTHVGYHEVPRLLTVPRIQDVIELTDAALHKIRGRAPVIVVCGLNPHAGEHGLFGDREEERIIEPAIASARANGINVVGPLPGDTAFIASRRRTTDAFVCMYHDQGHIPVKALAFDRAVNTTLGLPIIRTSVDHGTALDIAWQGKADPGSLFCAIRLAVQLGVPT